MPRTHSALPRLFVAADLLAGEAVALDRQQSHYLATVLRLAAGDDVILFNGRQGAWLARIADAGRKSVTLGLIEQTAAQPLSATLWYGFAPIKSGRLDYIVQKATEMGVGIIQPVITRFTQTHRLNYERLRANIIEAAEQCEVLSVPRFDREIAIKPLLDGWTEHHGDRALVFADEAEPGSSPLDVLAGLRGRQVGLLVGPEGGFSNDERALLRGHGFVVPISLGPRILRADTAAVAALAIIQACIGDWR